MKKAFRKNWILELNILLFIVMIVAVSVGSANLSVLDSFKLVLDKIPGLKELVDVSDISTAYDIIVWKVRIPRILMAALVGGALAIVGGAFQGVFGNSLADPHILGVSSGAAVGATIAMLTGVSVSFFGLGAVGAFAFIGALVTVFFVYKVARIGGQVSTVSMLLTGTAISTMLSAFISLLMTFNSNKIEKVYMWTLGSFSSANWKKVGFLAIFVLVGFILLLLYRDKLNLLMMGEEDAKSLGLDTEKTRRHIIIIASLIVAACVSVSGVIGFVGLIIPHCVRLLGGYNNRKLIPYSFYVGAVFTVICDTIARTVASPTEIPVGIITSLFGAPYFIFLIVNKKK